jgi:multiple sugar transport system permease protein
MQDALTVAGEKVALRGGFWRRLADDDRWLFRAMLAPAIVFIIALVGFPLLLSLFYSVADVTVGSRDTHFVGLENFRRIVNNPGR